jgi:hypothetical protein
VGEGDPENTIELDIRLTPGPPVGRLLGWRCLLNFILDDPSSEPSKSGGMTPAPAARIATRPGDVDGSFRDFHDRVVR